MSMTQASSEYFEQVAGQWDAIRAGYFTDAVRQAAIDRSYLTPEMVVADIGAGTGFIAAGLAPLVRRVYVLDGSTAMLEIARENLKGFNNIIFQEADGQNLPLPDESLDAVFANMYLHHCPDPLAAIREMVRILRPGGRLTITDMDAHPYQWLKEELADVWMGFEREQLRAWYQDAGLVNLVIDCSGQSCSAESKNPEIKDSQGREAHISIFLATGTRPVPGIHSAVREIYGAQAEGKISGCSTDCCTSTGPEEVSILPDYSLAQKASIPEEAAAISLGCGNPTAFANLRPGEVVLDIGSGGGIDVFLAAQKVGPTGKVIGVDMTPAMLERARRAAANGGFSQVEFRQGQAEALPVEDHSVDVILSNCVINLCADKGRVFFEAARVLKPGGRLDVSDMVTDRPFPMDLRTERANWSGCVFGSLPEPEYLDLIHQAGFTEVTVQRSSTAGESGGVKVYSISVSARKGGEPVKSSAWRVVDLGEAPSNSSCGCGGGSSCCG